MQPEIDPLEVRIRMLRMGKKGTFFARRHHVTKMSVSKALRGDRGMRKLLIKIHNSLNVLESQSMKRTSEKLKTINNPYEIQNNSVA